MHRYKQQAQRTLEEINAEIDVVLLVETPFADVPRRLPGRVGQRPGNDRIRISSIQQVAMSVSTVLRMVIPCARSIR